MCDDQQGVHGMTDRDRVALEEEASSLPIHVKMCAYRHDAIMSEIRDLRSDADKRLGRIEKAAWGILAAIGTGGLATLSQLAPLMQALAGQ
jgi:hypothetical protein